MVTHPPEVGLSSRYTVTEASMALGIHRTTLLRYTKAGKIKAGWRSGTGRKFYTGREILRFWEAQK
ncbi:MAG: helix-turn-helix domain-containing protein [Muribaculaceae bacterium]|nr:helix-turn-helix domain-containing protein [Muribaculaceae bacterium]